MKTVEVRTWHAETGDDVCGILRTSPEGLDDAQATERLRDYGANELRFAPPTPAWRILIAQFRSVVVLLLAGAALLAWLIGDSLDAWAIGAVLVLNAAIGFITEMRARRAIESLTSLTLRRATVKRPGHPTGVEVDARVLVPGDVVIVEAGSAVPADARLLVETGLRVNESPLTGESVPVSKTTVPRLPATALADRATMVYTGTTVADGRATAVVVATGMQTEIGRIGGLVSTIKEGRTPLEHRLDALGHRLVWLAIGIAIVVGALGWSQGLPWSVVIATGLALAVAAVPEGLPAVATIALAVGVRRMAGRRALVRRVPAVESLGSVTVVCTDKTGTLTAGNMVATRLWVGGRHHTVAGTGYEPAGEITPPLAAGARLAVEAAVLAGRGEAVQDATGWVAHGDPTDVALLVLGRRVGVDRSALSARWPETGEVPFTSELRLMATFHRDATGADAGPVRVAAKGAPQAILDRCTSWIDPEGTAAPLTPDDRAAIEAVNAAYASAGLRVIAMAEARGTADAERALHGMTWLGLAGLIDPPADGVRDTIARFRQAGIRTVMITGDQALTARAIGLELGVITDEESVVTGETVDGWSDPALADALPSVGAYSRVSPDAKLRIVTGLQARGDIVAVLGDGMNDAAALKQADVGVAMGRRGTDVARDASDVVLQDDWFPTIGAAIEEGRVIYDNIRKFVFYLFSCNLAEIIVLLVAGLFGALPLAAIQILWLNLVTDTFPALALAMEPAEPDVMTRPPRPPGAALLTRRFLRSVATHASLIAAVTLGAYAWARSVHSADASTVAFMTLALAQIFHLGTARSHDPVVTPARVVSNPWALGAVALVVGLQVAAVTVPPLQRVLKTDALSGVAWAVVLAAAALPAVVAQLWRHWRASRES